MADSFSDNIKQYATAITAIFSIIATVGGAASEDDATVDGGGRDSFARAVRSGDGAAADDGGGDCALVGCTNAVEDVTEV